MRTNLSSKIKLDSIPRRYYAPGDEIEAAALTREEKIDTRIYETIAEGSEGIAEHVVHAMDRAVAKKGKFVMAIGAGNSTMSVYSALIDLYKSGKISFKDTVVFNLTEFYNDGATEGPSTFGSLKENFLDHIDIPAENIHTFNTSCTRADVAAECREYENLMETEGGLDLVLCQVGPHGAIGFNEPGATISSTCRLVLLSAEQRQGVASSYKVDTPPTTALTLGMSNILRANRIITMAWGENRAEIVAQAVEGPATPNVPASLLQNHTRTTLVIDITAAESLTRISHPWMVTTCEWNDKLIRRAIVWLCQQTGKPILKLTNQDYNDHGLGELLAIYGSGYNVNIKVFNELQHTITGWPGGKPDADDTYRPERAKPYPKRVVVFSPHPDDDVISMGGTIRRLVEQKHDVHVAYETSGNIAVGDEEVIRFLHFINGFNQIFNNSEDQVINDKYAEIRKYLKEKKDGDMDTRDILTIKGLIRRGEARTACTYNNIPLDHCHFLDLPFYETGKIQKNPISEADVEIVRNLLREVKPHQIFVAGDLADPHGTHRTCMEAVLGALEVVKDDEWLKNCHLWLYRGAWMEWDLGMVDMAVPLSPDEMIMKRHAIYRHLSQKDIMPFPGSDPREFWQRAEERTQNTARLYDKLGMAEYQAIEVFVRMF